MSPFQGKPGSLQRGGWQGTFHSSALCINKKDSGLQQLYRGWEVQVGEGLEVIFIPSTPEVGSSVSQKTELALCCVEALSQVAAGSPSIQSLHPDSANTVIVPKGQDHREWVVLAAAVALENHNLTPRHVPGQTFRCPAEASSTDLLLWLLCTLQGCGLWGGKQLHLLLNTPHCVHGPRWVQHRCRFVFHL